MRNIQDDAVLPIVVHDIVIVAGILAVVVAVASSRPLPLVVDYTSVVPLTLVVVVVLAVHWKIDSN